jgi:hypothetical protein
VRRYFEAIPSGDVSELLHLLLSPVSQNSGFIHLRSFGASGTASTALWVNQYLADHGSDSISSVLRLRRVEPSELSKTPQGRRERKLEATSSVEVDDVGGKVFNCEQESSKAYSYDDAPSGSSNEEETFSSQEQNDPFIDQAAGLLISLGHTVA